MVEPSPSKGEAWHALSVEEVAQRLKTDLKNGLCAVDAKERLRQNGPNEIEAKAARSLFSILVAQFKSLIVLLLAVAAGISFAIGWTVRANLKKKWAAISESAN